MSAPPKLGILAGGGELPGRLAAACREAGREVFVVAFEGEADAEPLTGLDHAWTGLAAVGKTLGLLRDAGCQEVVLVGKIRRPAFTSLKLDRRGAALAAKLFAGERSDGAVLSLIVAELERAGFRVVGAHEVARDLLAPEGPLGRLAPNAREREDIALGVRVVRALGALDVGQAAVVADGLVLGVEAQEGTDALIRRCAGLGAKGRGGVVVKLRKPAQDRRVDLPTIGVTTVETAHAAGLVGIAVEAASTLIVDREAVVRAADAAAVFVVGVAPAEG